LEFKLIDYPKADLTNKLSILEAEADESAFWLEMLAELRCGEKIELDRLTNEASLTAITVSSKKTVRGN
jgi:hypothetical protein